MKMMIAKRNAWAIVPILTLAVLPVLAACQSLQDGARIYCERPAHDRAALRERVMTLEGPAVEIHCERVGLL